MADRAGQHIDDYRLIRLLGTGSFGEVYLGEHLGDQTLVAVKMLSLNQENLKEFVKEASTTLRLKHPHIIHLQALGMSADDSPYLIMDYAPNGTLRQRHTRGARLPLDTIVSYLLPLAEALQYAHDRRVIHRDVKPENVLIGQYGEVLLSDFGIAVIAPIEQSLSTQNLGGTVPYMAPEQIRGKPLPASDQYALGIMAYEWLCGVRPFQGTIWEILNQHQSTQPPLLCEKLPDLPPMVEEIILKALAKDPQERFARVQDFATALQQATHVGKASPALSSSSLLLALSPTDVSLQLEHAPDQSATPQPEQTTDKLHSRETLADEHEQPLVVTNPTPSPPTATSHTASESPSVSSSPTSSPRTPQPAPVPSMPPAIRRDLTRGKLILFVGLLLLIVGGSVFFSLSVINSLVKNFPIATVSPDVMFGFDPAHTHWNPYEKVLNRTNVSHLKLNWSYTTGDGIRSSPAVANGVVYVGSYDTKLYAFDASCRRDCQPLWSYPTGSSIGSSPAVANGLVYIGSADGKLYAFDGTCHSGCQPLWSYATGGVIHSSPAVANGIVYVGSDDQKLYAFDASCHRDCQPLWFYATGRNITSSPAVANGVVYVGSWDQKLYAFDTSCRRDCQPLWSYPTGDLIASSPTVANGIVYVGNGKIDHDKVGSYDGKLYAFGL